MADATVWQRLSIAGKVYRSSHRRRNDTEQNIREGMDRTNAQWFRKVAFTDFEPCRGAGWDGWPGWKAEMRRSRQGKLL